MTQDQYRKQSRENRIAARRAAKPARRANMWRMWAQGRSMLRAIHEEIATKLASLHQAENILANVGEPKGV